jgi:bacterial/archaeal transporter family-2 protein
MPNWMFLVLPVIGGAMVALQQPLNGGLGRIIGPNWATVVALTTGVVVSTVLALATGNAPSALSRTSEAPWYFIVGGGTCGALLVLTFATAVPRIGVTALIFASVTGQIITAMVIDHFGWLGVARQPIDWRRALAVPVVLVALWLVRRPETSGAP